LVTYKIDGGLAFTVLEVHVVDALASLLQLRKCVVIAFILVVAPTVILGLGHIELVLILSSVDIDDGEAVAIQGLLQNISAHSTN